MKDKYKKGNNIQCLKVLFLDAGNGFYRMERYRVGDFFGPVDLGIHLAFKHNALAIGARLLAGSVFPGSNRLVVAGISPCWHGFYVSTMGGAALVFDNLGIKSIQPADGGQGHGGHHQVPLRPEIQYRRHLRGQLFRYGRRPDGSLRLEQS